MSAYDHIIINAFDLVYKGVTQVLNVNYNIVFGIAVFFNKYQNEKLILHSHIEGAITSNNVIAQIYTQQQI